MTPHLGGDSLRSHFRPYLQSFPTPPKVVIIGNYGRGNLGDEAILAGILNDISDVCVPQVLTREPDRVSRLHGVRGVQSLSFEAIRTVLRCDVVSIGGGGIFGNGMTLLPRLLPIVAVMLQLLGKKVVFAAIGAYSTAPRWVSALLRLIALRSPLITVRDPESAATFGTKAKIVRDPGGDLPPAAAEEAQQVLAVAGVALKAAVLGLSVKPAMNPQYDERQHELVSAACEWWLANTAGHVVIFVMSSRGDFGLGKAVSDRTLADQIVHASSDPSRLAIVGPDLHPSMMKAVIGRSSVVLAHRLHAQIFAWSTGVEVVGMSYERKSDEFLRLHELPRIGLAEPSDADEGIWLSACRRAASLTPAAVTVHQRST